MTHIKISNEVISSRLGDELILLDMGNGQYFSLNKYGSIIWEIIELKKLKTKKDIFSYMERNYELSDEIIEDIDNLFNELVENKLINVS
ncbi:MAG: hypothetical protein CMG64_07620 [Candidatus Marinimicrobia bacterium]|nr:hypothetical protein [Candidatus Neomarinimicrobiota bacterium]|tara:strand:+ start:1471 stop:1737 length:267 start_codon:yes stop_codon:yes gene_type:complete